MEELTFGEKAVGITFNPSNNDAVYSIKAKYAEIINDLHDLRTNTTDLEVVRQCSIAITELQTSQMWAVKALTWNY
jgi:hypothetical protein